MITIPVSTLAGYPRGVASYEYPTRQRRQSKRHWRYLPVGFKSLLNSPVKWAEAEDRPTEPLWLFSSGTHVLFLWLSCSSTVSMCIRDSYSSCGGSVIVNPRDEVILRFSTSPLICSLNLRLGLQHCGSLIREITA